MESSKNAGKYEKSEYSTRITYKDPVTGEKKTADSNRTVYKNNELDLDMVIPAGTKWNGHTIAKDTTNRELMEKGNAPFLKETDEQGNTQFVKVELHHVTGQETNKGEQFFNERSRDGAMVEISSKTHKEYHKVLHISLDSSFRKIGKTKVKSPDAIKYEKFRRQYWKDRAKG